jgi:hypothetical protein
VPSDPPWVSEMANSGRKVTVGCPLQPPVHPEIMLDMLECTVEESCYRILTP